MKRWRGGKEEGVFLPSPYPVKLARRNAHLCCRNQVPWYKPHGPPPGVGQGEGNDPTAGLCSPRATTLLRHSEPLPSATVSSYIQVSNTATRFRGIKFHFKRDMKILDNFAFD